MLDKSHYSYLIAFTRQLANALDSDDSDLAHCLGSLASSLALLDADWSVDLGDDPRGIPESVDDVDAQGDDYPLGSAPARREHAGSDGDVVVTGERRLVAAGEPERVALGRVRRRPAVLTPPAPTRRRRSTRRGTK